MEHSLFFFSSDGVTSIRKSLFQIIQEVVAKRNIDVHLEDAKSQFPHCTPKTREALYYRYVLFYFVCKHFYLTFHQIRLIAILCFNMGPCFFSSGLCLRNTSQNKHHWFPTSGCHGGSRWMILQHVLLVIIQQRRSKSASIWELFIEWCCPSQWL